MKWERGEESGWSLTLALHSLLHYAVHHGPTVVAEGGGRERSFFPLVGEVISLLAPERERADGKKERERETDERVDRGEKRGKSQHAE